jgi:hypothetical protein
MKRSMMWLFARNHHAIGFSSHYSLKFNLALLAGKLAFNTFWSE